MQKLLKNLLIIIVSLFVISILIFFSQMMSGRNSLQEKREYVISVMKIDTARLSAFNKTEGFKRVFLTESKDSLDLLLKQYLDISR